MTSADATLDDLLSRWHHWMRARPSGYNQQSAGTERYRTSRQYDDTNGALDADLDSAQCKQVNHEAEQLTDPYRAAVYVEARRLCTGRDVWRSPRLPDDPVKLREVVFEARRQMIRRLRDSGVM